VVHQKQGVMSSRGGVKSRASGVVVQVWCSVLLVLDVRWLARSPSGTTQCTGEVPLLPEE
jgi:hypothetical protein